MRLLEEFMKPAYDMSKNQLHLISISSLG